MYVKLPETASLNHQLECKRYEPDGENVKDEKLKKKRPPRECSPSSLLVPIEVVAELLNVSVRRLYRWKKAGNMPAPCDLLPTKWVRQEIVEWNDDGCPDLTNDGLRYRKRRGIA